MTKRDPMKILAVNKKEIDKTNKIGKVYVVMYMSQCTEAGMGPAEI